MPDTPTTTIWIDADACPVVIKEILFRAADRTKTSTVFVANHSIKIPPSKYLQFMQVPKGFDIADNEIAKRCQSGDLVISSDIPLAAEVIEKGCQVLTPRGEKLTTSNIKSRLTMRDFMETMRSAGEQIGGPPPLSQRDRKSFADKLDKWLSENVS